MNYSLDSELLPVAEQLPELDLSDCTRARQLQRQQLGKRAPYECRRPVSQREVRIPGPSGAPDIAARVYSAQQTKSLVPALIYLHPGAFVLGDLDSVQPSAQAIADQVNTVVITVDYRLSPEHPYPAGLNDCYAALEWVSKNAAELGVDPERIGVLGEDAGGGLAAGLALLTLARRGPRLIAQFLDAPLLDDRLQTHSMRTLDDTPAWKATQAPISWKYYLGEGSEPGSDDISLYAAPARAKAEDLYGLPAAWLTSYVADPTRDESLEYACKMLEAGIAVDVHIYAGSFHLTHAFAPKTRTGARMLSDRFEALRRLLLAPL